MKRSPLIHPLLFTIFPVLFLYSHNIDIVFFREIWSPLLFSLALCILLFLVFRLISKDTWKASIIVSTFIVLFLSYGHVHHLIEGWRFGGIVLGRHVVLQAVWLLLFICISYVTFKTKSDLRDVTSILNVVAAILVCISLITIGTYQIRYRSGKRTIDAARLSPEVYEPEGSAGRLPDVYYIILDRYASNATLADVYDYDNSAFVVQLEKRGFYVARQSNANYPKTAHSLASSLNMEYINYLSDAVGEDSDNRLPLYNRLRDYKVWRFLKSRGYRFVHFGSFWEPTSRNVFADENYNMQILPEFSMMLYRTTQLYIIGKRLNIYDSRKEQRERVLYKFRKLAGIPGNEEPTFVFAHMLLPHEPHIFNRDGSYLSEEDLNVRSIAVKYIDQLIHTNTLVLDLVDRIIAASVVEPIIVIQADEGPFPKRYQIEGDDFSWLKASREEIIEKMGILNAYYLPGGDYSVLYQSITPVNSFRVIFNLYFDTELELLPDMHYIIEDDKHPYNFINITELVR